jgi:hypothetical protein
LRGYIQISPLFLRFRISFIYENDRKYPCDETTSYTKPRNLQPFWRYSSVFGGQFLKNSAFKFSFLQINKTLQAGEDEVRGRALKSKRSLLRKKVLLLQGLHHTGYIIAHPHPGSPNFNTTHTPQDHSRWLIFTRRARKTFLTRKGIGHGKGFTMDRIIFFQK